MSTNSERNTSLFIKRNLNSIYILSFIVTLLMTITAIIGFLYRETIYPTDALLQAFLPNDVVNILIGLPILLGAMWLARRGRLTGLLLWPGALFYILYNYMIYLFAMPLTMAFLLHLLLVTLSMYTLISLLTSLDGEAIQKRLDGAVPERFAGGVLAGLGLLFLIQVTGAFAAALTGQTPILQTELALHISDFLFIPAWIIGGVLLWQKKEFGYVAGLGLLYQASMLFVALIVFLILQPSLTNVPFALVDVIVIFIMGLVCFVPFGLFVRGVEKSRGSHLP